MSSEYVSFPAIPATAAGENDEEQPSFFFQQQHKRKSIMMTDGDTAATSAALQLDAMLEMASSYIASILNCVWTDFSEQVADDDDYCSQDREWIRQRKAVQQFLWQASAASSGAGRFADC